MANQFQIVISSSADMWCINDNSNNVQDFWKIQRLTTEKNYHKVALNA